MIDREWSGKGPEEECKLGQGYVVEERGGEKKQLEGQAMSPPGSQRERRL